jgi:AcrR family transcriptional regulator
LNYTEDSKPILGKMAVNPSYRQRQSAETRTRVAVAARKVFAERGYSAATIADIAEAAGVAVPTVYKLYGNKRALLTEVSNRWARAYVPNDPIPREPREAIAWWARIVRRQWETGLDIAMTYAGAVVSEAEVRKELEPRLAARDEMIRSVCEVLAQSVEGALSTSDAVALVSAITLPEVYRELVRDRGWTPDRYQEWVERSLVQQLVAS